MNWALFAQAQQLAYADRDQYVADTRQVDVPLQGMLHPDYLAQRAALISKDSAMASIFAGDPWKYNTATTAQVNGIDATLDVHGTTHFVIVDAQGDVVSMTATVESIFGTTRMVGGMFLNNELTDFSFRHIDDKGLPIANAVAPNKKPRSSMSPTIVLDNDGRFLMATGSPGGNNIIAYTAKTLVGVFDWGLSPQQAVDLPNMVARGEKVRLEKDTTPDSLIKALRDFGLNVDASRGENSGLSVILRKPDGTLEGAADKRREGVIGTL
jgi:gamma-glutamyltranspeptidase/glutathione hydrolase